jgi:hypothetical protein
LASVIYVGCATAGIGVHHSVKRLYFKPSGESIAYAIFIAVLIAANPGMPFSPSEVLEQTASNSTGGLTPDQIAKPAFARWNAGNTS